MAWGTPTAIGTAESAAGATIAVTVPAGGVPAGALIVVFIGEQDTVIGGSVADTAGNTYTAVGGKVNSTPNCYGRFFYAYNVSALVSANSITFTKHTSGSRAVITAWYVTGSQIASDPLDAAVSATNSGNVTSQTVTSGAPSVAGELLVACCCFAGTDTDNLTNDATWSNTPPTSARQTSGGAGNPQIYGGRVVEAGTSAHTFTGVTVASRSWAASVIGFKVAATATNRGLPPIFF